MLRFLAPLILITSAASLDVHTSAASAAQIKFAEENNYDNTGPGAKQPEYAYHTYKTLEEALVAFLDDPDTKLPDHERAKALDYLNYQKLYKPYNYYTSKPYSLLTNDLKEPKVYFSSQSSRYESPKFSTFGKTRFHPAYYTREPEAVEYRPSPTYSHSGVYKRKASNPTVPSRPEEDVRGHYTFVDAAGTHRTIQYYGGGKLTTTVKSH